MADHPVGEYTVDELARAAGITVRSVRVYHERGVLPAPEVRGRTGYYGPVHLERLQAISRLLERGMKLAGIRQLFDAWDRGDGLAEVLGFVDQVATPYHAESPATITRAELRRYGTQGDILERAIAVGIYEPTDDPEILRVISPRLSRFGAALTDFGLPLERTVPELEQIKAACDRVAARHAELFHDLIWEPYKRSNRTPEDLARVTEYLAITRHMPAETAAELVSLAAQRFLETTTPELLDAIRGADPGD
jgi:DNA-binding transcriptional MerR regulator